MQEKKRRWHGSPERAINATKWDKKSTWLKLAKKIGLASWVSLLRN